ncbi:hypothetical protein T11_10516, partial [Trichinella zimbabwensis]
KATAKEDSSPLKAEIKSEPEIKELKDDVIDEGIEAKELTPVVEEKLTEEVVQAEEEVEIKDEEKKKKNSKKKSKSKKRIKR